MFTVSAASAQDLIHYWNFNDPAGSGNPWPQPIAANHGTGSLTYSFESGIVSFAGTTENARQGAVSGQSFSIQGGTGLENNGRHFQLNFSALGYEDLVFSYATRGTASGFNSQRAEFSVDNGSTWTHIGTETGSRATAFYRVAYDLSAFQSVQGAANVIIRVVLNGATNETGNNRFDNIAIDGTFVGGTSPGTGTGTATLSENLIRGGQTVTLNFTVAGRSTDEEDLLTRVDFTLPAGWGPVTADNVALSPQTGSVAVEGQTISITDISVSDEDPIHITVSNLWVPDQSTAERFSFSTAGGTDAPVLIASQPQLMVWSTPLSMAQASANNSQGVSTRLNEWVTIQGIVTVADEFATAGGELGPTFLQDATGGMGVFSPINVSPNVAIGDEVVLLGRVTQFFGFNQLDASTVVVETVSTGNVVNPTIVTLAQLASDGQGGVEVYEGRLVRINNVTVQTPVWTVDSGQTGTNYTLSDGTATLDVRINTAVDFAGQPAPSGAFDLIAVVSQFSAVLPHIGGYQVLPRFSDDIIDDSMAPVITSTAPFETAATPTTVTVTWTTDRPAHTEVRYVRYLSSDTLAVVDETPKTEHSVTLTDLDPAHVYTLEFRSAVATDTTSIPNYPVSTTAAPGTTHEIQVYFNGTVDQTYAVDTPARSASPLPRLVELINGAQHSVDAAFYSLSGGAGSQLANALIAAHNRGVMVRVLMDNSTSNTAPPTSIRNAGVPFITDQFGANDGMSLHHNKVVVIDYKGGSPETIWAMTGSWNPTDPGTTQHNQNILFIQDGAVAAAYTREYDQMWGSSTITPNAAESRFGANKMFVAPSVFWIGDVYARLYFSPQGLGFFGRTERHIIDALNTADHAIDLGLNLITRQSIVDAMHARFNEGVAVRGAIGEITTTGSVFNQLASWADVHDHPQSPFGLLHHKYALIDAEHPDSNPTTITGSHNWSRSANESNDENTLIIYDADITNQFLQEYVVRYREAGGEADFSVSIEHVDPQPAEVFSVSANYPNPFRTSTTFEYHLPVPSHVSITVYNLLGQQVMRLADSVQPAGTMRLSFDGGDLASGVYLYQVEAVSDQGAFRETRRMTIAR